MMKIKVEENKKRFGNISKSFLVETSLLYAAVPMGKKKKLEVLTSGCFKALIIYKSIYHHQVYLKLLTLPRIALRGR